MPVYALTSVCGSPGVSTTAIAWAYHSPRPTLIIEADVTGGSPLLAGAFGGTMLHRNSILALASTESRDWAEMIWRQAVPLPDITERNLFHADHAPDLPDRMDRWVLPAIGRGHQARAMAPLWRPLAQVLTQIATDTDIDVIIDAGRLGIAGGPWDLIEAADAILLLTDSTIPALTTLALALDSLRVDLAATGSPDRLGVVPITGPSRMLRPWTWASKNTEPDIRPYGRAEIAATTAPTAVIATIPHAPRAAATYMQYLPRRGTTTYDGAIKAMVSAAAAHARSYATLLNPGQEDA